MLQMVSQLDSGDVGELLKVANGATELGTFVHGVVFHLVEPQPHYILPTGMRKGVRFEAAYEFLAQMSESSGSVTTRALGEPPLLKGVRLRFDLDAIAELGFAVVADNLVTFLALFSREQIHGKLIAPRAQHVLDQLPLNRVANQLHL